MKIEIKPLRLSANMTQQELADKVGVSASAMNFFETGLKLPSLTVAYNIAKTLGVKIDDLIVN